MYYPNNDPKEKPQLFQPYKKDKWTFIHCLVGYILALACYLALTHLFLPIDGPLHALGIDLTHIKIFISVNFAFWVLFAYEVGQATGDKSEEGIDPLDLVMNFAGALVGAGFVPVILS